MLNLNGLPRLFRAVVLRRPLIPSSGKASFCDAHHICWNRKPPRCGLGRMNARISEGENTMKRIVILNAFALMAGTGVAMAFPCPTSDCVIDEPSETQPT